MVEHVLVLQGPIFVEIVSKFKIAAFLQAVFESRHPRVDSFADLVAVSFEYVGAKNDGDGESQLAKVGKTNVHR